MEIRRCPSCGHEVEKENQLICMYCGKSLTPGKKFDKPDSNLIGKKDENFSSTLISLGALWWILLGAGGIISMTISFKLLFELF